MIVVLTTATNLEDAESLAEKIVAEKLAACVQILPEMKSIYFWEGAVQNEPEHLLLIKTLPEKFEELEKFIRTNHSYNVPEIVALQAEKSFGKLSRLDKELFNYSFGLILLYFSRIVV